MSISLLGGMLKGHSLKVPPSAVTRPTAIQLKRRIFDSYQDLSGHDFIDLCSGSGSIGLEAWSRGAREVFLIESHRKAYQCLKENIASIEKKHAQEFSERRIEGHMSACEKWLGANDNLLANEDVIVYLDPPYEKIKTYEKVIKILCGLSFTGQLWLEGDRQKGKEYGHWCKVLDQVDHKVYEQGTSYIIRFAF